jgi:sialidase-1
MCNRLLFNALLIIVFVVPCFILQGQDFVTVFSAGKEGHSSYRIPAIIGMSNGKLIAFAEGRVNHAGDFGRCRYSYEDQF